MRRGAWSPEETEVLLEMAKRGCGSAEIAAAVNRDRKSVTERKRRLGLSTDASQPWTKAEENKLREMLAAGKSQKEIAETLGRTPSACANKRRELKLPVCSAPFWTRQEDEELTKLVEAGKNRREIAEIMGRSDSAILQRCYMFDLKCQQGERKERKEPDEPRGTLCWRCEKACIRGCSWAARFEPVPGWDAKPNGKSYQVNACPEFEPDKRWRPQWDTSNT